MHAPRHEKQYPANRGLALIGETIKFFIVLYASFYLLSAAVVCHAATLTANEIIKKIEDNLNGKTAAMKIVMTVKTRRTERTIKMESYSVGKEKSFIQITYPQKDQGITFLKVDNAMWQYVPRIEKTIKIPASMMLQSWMGSDFTNDDLVRESSISDDYDGKITKEDDKHYEIELIPKEDAAVVWGRIVMTIDRAIYLPTAVSYYDEDGTLIRALHYEAIKKFGEKLYPSRWVVAPRTEDKIGHQTIIEIDDVVFDEEIDASYFTKRALKRFSR
jgi:outer membrane lipoprotein-sorting protein